MDEINRDVEKREESRHFTIKVCGMSVVGVGTNGHAIGGVNVRSDARVQSVRLGVNAVESPMGFRTELGVRKVLETLEQDVLIEVTEHLIETQVVTTSVRRHKDDFFAPPKPRRAPKLMNVSDNDFGVKLGDHIAKAHHTGEDK